MLDRVCRDGVVVGMDLFIEGLEISRRRSGAKLVQGRVEQPPFRQRFDLIGLFDTLEHVEDDLTVLRHLKTLMSDRGKLLIVTPERMRSRYNLDVRVRTSVEAIDRAAKKVRLRDVQIDTLTVRRLRVLEPDAPHPKAPSSVGASSAPDALPETNGEGRPRPAPRRRPRKPISN